MEMNKYENIISNLLRLIAAGLLFWALDRHTYYFYILLRCVVCIVSVYSAYLVYKSDKNYGWIWLFSIIAIFFNPIFPVRLSKDTWAIIDVITAIVMVLSVLFFTSRNRKIISSKILKKNK